MVKLDSSHYSVGDLAAILAAIAYTAAATGGHSPADVQFQRGFAAALGAVAVAVHIDAGELAALAGYARGQLEGQR